MENKIAWKRKDLKEALRRYPQFLELDDLAFDLLKVYYYWNRIQATGYSRVCTFTIAITALRSLLQDIRKEGNVNIGSWLSMLLMQ